MGRKGVRVYPPKVIDIAVPERNEDGNPTGKKARRRFEVHRDESVVELIPTKIGKDGEWIRTRRSRIRNEHLRLSVIFHLLRAMGKIPDDELPGARKRTATDELFGATDVTVR